MSLPSLLDHCCWSIDTECLLMVPLYDEIRACRICEDALPHEPRPVFAAFPKARIAIIGQAPGSKVHQSGKPWADASGNLLRTWMGIDDHLFYESGLIALVPMGFCYPGKGKSGDLPPRPECAPAWHEKLFAGMPTIQLTLLIGNYAQAHYLKDRAQTNLTETVRRFADYGPGHFPLPHPSPRNRPWLAKNPWFAEEVLPALKKQVATALT